MAKNIYFYILFQILPSRPGAYGLDDTSGIGVHREPGFEGFTAGASIKGYPSPLGNSNLLSKGQDVTPGVNTAILDVIDERNSSMRNIDGLSGPGSAGESNILFVDGLPTDCTRREVGRILWFALIFLLKYYFPRNLLILFLARICIVDTSSIWEGCDEGFRQLCFSYNWFLKTTAWQGLVTRIYL